MARDRVSARMHIYPKAEHLEDQISRGELRLAAEATLEHMMGNFVPSLVQMEATRILQRLAR